MTRTTREERAQGGGDIVELVGPGVEVQRECSRRRPPRVRDPDVERRRTCQAGQKLDENVRPGLLDAVEPGLFVRRLRGFAAATRALPYGENGL